MAATRKTAKRTARKKRSAKRGGAKRGGAKRGTARKSAARKSASRRATRGGSRAKKRTSRASLKRQAEKGLQAARGGLDTVRQVGDRAWETLKSTTAQVVEGVKETLNRDEEESRDRTSRREFEGDWR
jgi:hypothetical protein